MRLVNPGVQDGSITIAKLAYITRLTRTGLTANDALQTLVTPAVGGLFRICAWITQTQLATTSGTLPEVDLLFTDNDFNQTHTVKLTATDTANALGEFGTYASGAVEIAPSMFYFSAKAGVAIQVQTANYASVGATPLKYNYYVLLEGPF